MRKHFKYTTIMPYDISNPFIKKIHREWQKATTTHKSYAVKNKFHKERRMDDWTNELRNIDTEFRKRIENAEKNLKREEAERYEMEQEEIQMRKEIMREKREKRRAEKEYKIAVGTVRVSRRRVGGN
jgi:hypothetical protein